MATPTIDQLHDPTRYEVVLRVTHHDIAKQIREFLRPDSWVTISYWLLNLLGLAYVGVGVLRSPVGFFNAFSISCVGMMAGWIGLLPIHEWVHALAYRTLGHRDVTVHYTLRTLTAFCIADRQVVNGRDFAAVALAPFVFLNPILLGLAVVTTGTLHLMCAGALLLHLGACSGDVAFVRMVWDRGGGALLTYDDRVGNVSYFMRPRGDGLRPPR